MDNLNILPSDLNQLYECPTYLIRAIGRNEGVKCPTTKNNKQIVKEIILIKKGKLKPHFSNLGRKPKPIIIHDAFKTLEKLKDTPTLLNNLVLDKLISLTRQNEIVKAKFIELNKKLQEIIDLL